MPNYNENRMIIDHDPFRLINPNFLRQFSFCLGGVCLLIALSCYNTEPSYRHFKWIAGTIWLTVMLPSRLIRVTLPKSILWTLGIMLGWIIYPGLLTPWATDKELHIKALCITVFYSLFCCSVLYHLMKTPSGFARYLFFAGTAWAGTNLILLILYFNNWFIIPYESRFFAGICTNRNNFAVITMVLFALLLFYRLSLPVFQKRWSILILSVLAILALITISLKALFGIPVLLISFFLY
jgi:hypothetical protein